MEKARFSGFRLRREADGENGRSGIGPQFPSTRKDEDPETGESVHAGQERPEPETPSAQDPEIFGKEQNIQDAGIPGVEAWDPRTPPRAREVRERRSRLRPGRKNGAGRHDSLLVFREQRTGKTPGKVMSRG
jgi:hypothetical protein